MTDLELLKMAAKAAGISCYTVTSGGTVLRDYQDHEGWNPLFEDGDALKLAVKLGMHVLQYGSMATVQPNSTCEFFGVDEILGVNERFDSDPYAATRRAIVRAAAQIGMRMK